MAVIRSSSTSGATFYSIKDADEDSRKMLDAARAEAAKISEAAQSDGFAHGHREGYQIGLAEGRSAGTQQALEEHRGQLSFAAEALAGAVADFERARTEFATKVLADCVDLALSVARRVTKRQAQFDPQVLAANLEHAVKLIVGAGRLRVAFHPHDAVAATEALEKLKLSNHVLDAAQLIEDPSLARGGCRIYTEYGLIDADINAQLDRLEEQVVPRPEEPK
jgi:flagellar assembly protein FliH